MDTVKLKSAEELIKGCEHDGSYIPVNEVIKLIKKVQRNAIEYALTQASENAEADYNITESFDRLTGEDIEVYVINSSILNLKEQIFKENNL